MGLADRVPVPTDHCVADLEHCVSKMALMDSDSTRNLHSDPMRTLNSRTPGEVHSGPVSTQLQASDRTKERDGEREMAPPASSSPAPFARMHMGRERGGAKRRSCAIACKVSGWCLII